MKIVEVIFACGHRNIQALHESTLEITKEAELTKKGDCIVAVSADKALADLSSNFLRKLRNEKTRIRILIEAGNISEEIKAFGSPKLVLSHPTDIVVRKSDYICSRTLAIHADKAACDLSRKLVEKLKNPTQKVKITLIADV